MSSFVPQLVKDAETGKLCIQIKLGGYSATLQLPEDFAGWADERKDSFYEMVTIEMKLKLMNMRRVERRKLKKAVE